MRKTVPFAILTLALLLAAAPVSQAQTSDEYGWAYLFAGQASLLTVEAGPNAVVFTLHDVTIDGQMAADARKAIDTFTGVGDSDGIVTDNEVIGVQAVVTSGVNSMLPQSFDLDMITLDGRAAFSEEGKTIQMTALKVKGATGPVTATDPIQTDVKVMMRFDSVDKTRSTHTLRFENLYGDFSGYDMSKAPPVEVQVKGYKSWAILEDTVEPAALKGNLVDGALVFKNDDIAQFEKAGTGLEFVIKGDPSVRIDDTKDSPALAPLVLISTVGALLVALRRRV